MRRNAVSSRIMKARSRKSRSQPRQSARPAGPRPRASITASNELTLPELRPLRILVAGEVILDRYVWGEVERISPEAPIPILRAQRREEKPGNSGFVMANLRALGARPVAFGVIGDDHGGGMVLAMFCDLVNHTPGRG